jgi:hypothetical protein
MPSPTQELAAWLRGAGPEMGILILNRLVGNFIFVIGPEELVV